MTNKTLEDIIKRILNDPDVFYIRYTIFNSAEWDELSKEYQKGNLDNVTSKIGQKINSLETKFKSQRNDRRLQNAIKLAEGLKNAIKNKPYILKQMFSTLEKFSLIKCNLPTMEDYGKIIENHNRSTVEQFFLYKIDRARGYQKRALRKTLEYLEELYAMNLNILEIAFFIRKLNSLTQFMEVIKDE